MPKPTLDAVYRELTAGHCRQARALLRWTQAELAAMAGVVDDTIYNIEREWTVTPRLSTRLAVFGAMERAGVKFIKENHGGIGVYLVTRKASNAA